MSQFGVPDAGAVAPMNGERSTSGLAVTALIMSLVFCCPITTVLGVLLGLGAVVTIGSNPMKKGKGIAVAAILIGLIATGAQIWAGNWAYQNFYKPVLKGPSEELMAGASGDVATFRAGMTGAAAAASDEEVRAFFDGLTARYGQLNGVSFDQARQPDQQMGEPVGTFFYVLDFDNGPVNAAATMIFADESSGEFVMAWSEIVIEDDELGDVVFPGGAPIDVEPDPDAADEGGADIAEE